MAEIPTAELIGDTRNYLRCLSPHVKERKAALLLTCLVERLEQLQDKEIEQDKREEP